MEFLNKVEIKGIVGYVAINKVSDKSITNLSLVTETCANSNGALTIEVTWFNCVAFMELEIAKGDKVHVIGRIRTRRYTDQDDNERVSMDVVVQSLEKIED